MSLQKKLKKLISSLLKKFLSVEELHYRKLEFPKNILVVRQHNQFGDMLASVSLFRAIKENFPSSNITLIASPENYFAVKKNSFIDRLFVFDKQKLINPLYLLKLRKILRTDYDIAIVPVTVAVSATSCILTGLSKSKIKIGPKSLDGIENELSYVFNYRIELDWKKNPDMHVSDFIQDIIKPFGISTKDFSSQVTFNDNDIFFAKKFIKQINSDGKLLIGFHVGAGKPQNRWSLYNFVDLINMLKENYSIEFYFTGSNSDKEELDFIKRYFPEKGYFVNKTIPQLAALISLSDLFITNDTGVMHVAGATSTPQISLFGPTNPFNWAPIGKNKIFIRRSELMNDIIATEVFNIAKALLKKEK